MKNMKRLERRFIVCSKNKKEKINNFFKNHEERGKRRKDQRLN
jgi:hypothetical protein